MKWKYALGMVIILAVVGWFGWQYTKSTRIVDRSDMLSLHSELSALPNQDISDSERDGLVFMREEEKLAHDVYIALYEKWKLPIFKNIATSEQTHTNAVRDLLVKYSIQDPAQDEAVGVFQNKTFQGLYQQLVSQGNTSLSDALTVGATIEDLDIADLQKRIATTDNADIILVYENLMKGSRNHLRSFTSQLTSHGGSYEPAYITLGEYQAIISSEKERGTVRGGGRY